MQGSVTLNLRGSEPSCPPFDFAQDRLRRASRESKQRPPGIAWIPAFAGMTQPSSTPQNHHDGLLALIPPRLQLVPLFHLLISLLHIGVKLSERERIDKGDESLFQDFASRHPLIVLPPPMAVRSIEL